MHVLNLLKAEQVCLCVCVGGCVRCVSVRLMFRALSEAISPLTQMGASTEAKIVRH